MPIDVHDLEPVPAPAPSGEAAGAPDYAAFGLDLFRRLADAAPDENVVVSPLSAGLALSVLANGATGATLAGIGRTLATGLEMDALNAANAALLDALEGEDVELVVASSVWGRRGVPVLPAYVEQVKRVYGAEAAAVDFASDEGVRRINGWVAEATGGRITEMVQHPVDPLVILFIFNAVYFKGRWEEEFRAENTRPRTFHAPAGAVERPMMFRAGRMGWLRRDGVTAVRLPYRGGRMSMYVLLPADGLALDGLRALLAPDVWEDWMDGFRTVDVHLAMPRFRIRAESVMNEALKAMGMEDAFTMGRAALDGMLPAAYVAEEAPYVSEVLQKVLVEVNEEGTEAAAATKVEIRTRSMDHEPRELVVDRPFVLAVRDDRTGALLFVGQVNDPGME